MRAARGNRSLTSAFAVTGIATLSLAGIGSAGAAPSAGGASNPTSTAAASPEVADSRLLVTVDPGTTSAQASSIVARIGGTLESRLANTLIVNPGSAPHGALSQLDAIPGVRAVEPNLVIHASASTNDPLFGDQYGLSDTQPGGIRAETAWNGTRGSRDVVVGVLDSGIDEVHPDLVDNLWTNRTGIHGCAYGTHGYNAFTDQCPQTDDEGHGTHVAGIIGATGNNGIGVSGVAQRVSLMSLKMLDRTGSGSEVSAVRAINFGLSAKAAGVNLRVFQASWGSDSSSVAIHDAITQANAAGILFVTAAGNGYRNDGTARNLDLAGAPNDDYPCEDSNSNVICVAASDQTGQLASFSNYGATAVDLAAPGFAIQSTVPRGLIQGCDPNSDYCELDGTSMATPMVSGAAVDILAEEPNLTVSQLRARILGSVDTLASLTGKVATGGRLDLCKALPNCGGLPSVAPTKPNDVHALARDGSVALSWTAPDSNGNSFSITGYEVQGPSGTTSLPFTTTNLTLNGLANNTTVTVQVRAIAGSNAGPWVAKSVRPYAGGYVVEGNGVVDPVGVGGKTPTQPSDGPLFPFNIVRGISIVPEGTGGYIVDGYGGLHRFRIGATSPLPPPATGGPYWLGWDIVRGVATSVNGGGYVLDGYGGLHPFGVGTDAPPVGATTTPYWGAIGFDIARGVVVDDTGTTGYMADGWGGIHSLAFGFASPPPQATNGPYWIGWNIVRGITLVPGSGGGWVLDGFGASHPFSTTGSAPAGPTSGPYWLGQDRARGIGL